MLEAKSGVWGTFCPRGCFPSTDLPVPLAMNHSVSTNRRCFTPVGLLACFSQALGALGSFLLSPLRVARHGTILILGVYMKLLQSCLFATPRTVGSSIHGIFQARILEWVAISYSRGSS